jgi:hypothetical protein
VFPSINDLDNNFIKGILVLDIINRLTNLRLPDSVDTPQLQPISDTHLLDNKHRYSQLDLPFPFLSSRPPTFVLPHSLNTITRKPRHQTHLRRPIPFSPQVRSRLWVVCLFQHFRALSLTTVQLCALFQIPKSTYPIRDIPKG